MFRGCCNYFLWWWTTHQVTWRREVGKRRGVRGLQGGFGFFISYWNCNTNQAEIHELDQMVELVSLQRLPSGWTFIFFVCFVISWLEKNIQKSTALKFEINCIHRLCFVIGLNLFIFFSFSFVLLYHIFFLLYISIEAQRRMTKNMKRRNSTDRSEKK